ncbi:thiopeptide-type bacteriocin biosynthesis protein [Actinomyces sp.]|uniref:thiopeptide-type bacteriocin biosynthesis protein n=1 Tax=Actinomyces sp. TaxID=29317 RepID=UPI0026DC176B|nr:thiopeptide-type bacteriocin biosynthesis protein [Actinomyces sp.]MDO4900397.1 thiopeptide-type bacteriocin biosynthesis protein [Actinomyces sp.]
MNSAKRDWLYVKIYSGGGDDVGALLPAVLEWKASLKGVDRWHFLRYMDHSGHHLRVRLRGRPEDVDDWYRDLPRLEQLARREPGRTMTRIIHDPMAERAGHGSGVCVGLYSPELAKYGGPEGMEDAELIFQESSQACMDNRVWTWAPLERLVAATDYIGAVEREAGFEPGTLSGRIADRWADRLRYGGLEPDKLRQRAPTLNDRLRSRACPPADWSELVQLTSRILAERSAAAAPDFPLDLVHMHINRIGLNPLEECLAAHLCETSSPTTEGDTCHDRPEPCA